MSDDDSTAASEIPPRRSHSGEWNLLDEIVTRLDRIEGKVDRNFRQTSALKERATVIEIRLTAVEKWQGQRDERGRQWSMGTWLSIIGSFAGPIATLVVLYVFGNHKGPQ